MPKIIFYHVLNPSRSLTLNLHGSVGAFAQNVTKDVRLVQTLLSGVPRSLGGALVPLKVDGIAGKFTINAIKDFQRRHTTIVDGRVDAAGPTIRKLIPIAESLNRVPVGFGQIGKPDGPVLSSLAQVSSQSLIRGGGRPAPTFPTEWRFTSSGSVAISVGLLGVAAGDLLVQRDSQPGIDYRLTFLGASVGMSFLPVGLDISLESMKSWGTRITAGAKPPLPFPPSRFEGPCIMLIGSASVGLAMGATVVSFNPSECNGLVAGVQVGMPGSGFSLLLGTIAGWR